jgi:hypothetical protein
MPNVAMKHEVDPRQKLLAEVGDVSEFEICNNDLLVAIYRRPEKTVGGIVLPRSNLNEDLFQSKAGLVLRMGPACEFFGAKIQVGDWIVTRPSDTFALEVNFVPCRLVIDKYVKAKIPNPEMVW